MTRATRPTLSDNSGDITQWVGCVVHAALVCVGVRGSASRLLRREVVALAVLAVLAVGRPAALERDRVDGEELDRVAQHGEITFCACVSCVRSLS